MIDTLVYQGTDISFEAEQLNLTDMWRAAGGDLSKQPAKWRALPSAQEFITHVAEVILRKSEDELFTVIRGGLTRFSATWAHWQIAMAYAKYLSAPFHAWCNDVVRARFVESKGASVQLPETIDSPIHRLDKLEIQVDKLVKAGRITELQALDAMTLAIKKELGYDLTAIPTLEYKQIIASTSSVQLSGPAVIIPQKEKRGTFSARHLTRENGLPSGFVTELAAKLGLIGDENYTEADDLGSAHHGAIGVNYRYNKAAVEVMVPYFKKYNEAKDLLKEAKTKKFAEAAQAQVLSTITEKVGTGTLTSATTIFHPTNAPK